MNDIFRKLGLTMVLISCIILTNAQTSTFSKIIGVSVNNKVQLTDMSNQPLKTGGLYRVQLSVLGTGTKTGAEYLVWYDNTNTKWTTRMVTVNGTNSNHPTLEILDDVVKVATLHTSTYQIKVFVTYYDAANANTVPSLFGSSYHWQRNASRLYYLDGNVGIGTATPQARLAVNGNILAKEIKVKTDITVPDYVFEEAYSLPTLSSIENYVKVHKHLPDVPSAKDIERDGLDLAEMNLLLLKKVEELTLHLIDKEKRVTDLERRMQKMENDKREP